MDTRKKTAVAALIFIAGNFLYLTAKFEAGHPLSSSPYPYIITAATYTLLGFWLNGRRKPNQTNKKLCIVRILCLIIVLISPFMLPNSVLMLCLVESHSQIFISLLLGSQIKNLTMKL